MPFFLLGINFLADNISSGLKLNFIKNTSNNFSYC